MDFEKHKGARVHRYFSFVTVLDSSAEKDWWCNGQWMSYQDAHAAGVPFSNHAPCRSLRAFKRHLRRHGEKGVAYALVNRYVGFDVTAIGRGQAQARAIK